VFQAVVVAVGFAAGAVASVSGFGIGSLLTPLLALRVGTKTAVAAVSVPHVVGTAIRFWRLRMETDRRLLIRFGLPSAAGGLTGALLHARASNPALAIVLGVLLVVAGVTQLTGPGRRWRFHGSAVWIAGGVSGLFGGLVGNQGGIRAAALLGFDLRREAFVATATAIALVVDVARMPVYVVSERDAVAAIVWFVITATIGVVAGTLLGNRLLARVPEPRFRQVVGTLLLVLGAAMILSA
jgi:uncharacterized membrane protein YfcA